NGDSAKEGLADRAEPRIFSFSVRSLRWPNSEKATAPPSPKMAAAPPFGSKWGGTSSRPVLLAVWGLARARVGQQKGWQTAAALPKERELRAADLEAEPGEGALLQPLEGISYSCAVACAYLHRKTRN
ncbi:UNVERIFIED_CONTAM: hypothetical protein K2H54_033904, partial [Gekko kuhli]